MPVGVYRHRTLVPQQSHPVRLLPQAAGTRFYLQAYPPPETYRPAGGDLSAALPVGTLNSTAGADGVLSTIIGQVEQDPIGYSALAQTPRQDAYIGRFIIESSLPALTVAANTWTFAFQAAEPDANANVFLALSLYIYRPSTTSVVGYVYDGGTALGSEWPLTRGPQIVTFSGSAVATNNGDVLILEVWTTAAQAVASSYSSSFYYGGTADIQDGVIDDAATYLETPQNLGQTTTVASSGQTFYLLSSLAPSSPTAGDKSVVLPTGTFEMNASGTADEQRLMDVTAAASQVAVTWNSLAQTARQTGYVARWTSMALAAQSLAAGTWTVAFAASEANAAANSFCSFSLYIWRAGAVAAYLFDSTAAFGTEWATSEQGRVVTFSGNSFTLVNNDLLVFEFWHTAIQGNATARSNSLYYNGTTQPTNLVTATTAASYLQSPAALTFYSAPASPLHLLGLLGVGR